MSHFSFSASFLVVLLALAVLGFCGWLSLSIWRRSGERKGVLWLEFVRFALIALLGFTLLRPEFVKLIHRSDPPEIAILTDASRSMETKDIILSSNVMSRTEWIRAKEKESFWKPLEKGARVTHQSFSAPPTATNGPSEGTDLGGALEKTLEQQKNLKAVLMLTDGDWNMGKSPVGTATRYREQNIPIFSIAIGRDSPLPDLVLQSMSAPSYGLFGEEISIGFSIKSSLAREVKTTISLWNGTTVESKKEIVIPAQGELQDAILWSPRAAVETTLILKLPLEPDEALPENNQQSARINIRMETLKVLVIDSVPRWEYRYLRNALARDPGVEMNCLLYHPGMSTGGGRNYLPAFPGTKDALSRYDVIFLGDIGVGQNELTPNDLELIKGVVGQQATGLIFLPGRRGREQTLVNGPLEDLLPVTMDPTKAEGIGLQNEATLVLSSVGKHHLLTRFDADENKNDEIWKQLPGFSWSAGVLKSRAGSEVLAVHSSLRNSSGRLPLLVTRAYGSGKVLFLGTDSAWRWRRGVEDKYHYRFWSQVVRWMAHQRHLSEKQGIRLSYTPESPQVGEMVYLQSTVFDVSGFPLENGKVLGTLTGPSGRSERIEFANVEGGWGVFKGNFSPQESGRYKIHLATDKAGPQLDTEFMVAKPELEKLGQPVNRDVLAEMAGITKGASGSVESLNDIIQKISVLPEPAPLESRIRLWSNPWWGGVILLLLVIYWTGRKLAGMI